MIYLLTAFAAAMIVVAAPALIVGRSTELIVRHLERKRKTGENRENG